MKLIRRFFSLPMYAWLCRSWFSLKWFSLKWFSLKHSFALVMCGVVLAIGLVGFSGLVPSIALAVDYNREFLVNKDFSGKDLTDASFTKANMRGSNLSHTNLQGVSFFGANLESANLEGANLSVATLDQARMVGANLKNAVLEGAFAFNTKFNNAIIEGADFTDVLLREDMQDILCQTASGTNPTTGRDTRETLGC